MLEGNFEVDPNVNQDLNVLRDQIIGIKANKKSLSFWTLDSFSNKRLNFFSLCFYKEMYMVLLKQAF